MKRTLQLLGILFLSLTISPIFAQPPNDHPCDAIALSLDSTSVFSLSLSGATVDPGEEAIAPPLHNGCDVDYWCGNAETNTPAISRSMWFKFTATTEDVVAIDLCASNFDTQLALYRVTDCANFDTYELIWLNDNGSQCGVEEGYGKSARLITGCLDLGAEYYILVDEGLEAVQNPGGPADVVLGVSTYENPDPGPLIVDLPMIIYPTCPGGSDGAIGVCLLSGTPPVRFDWSHGGTTRNVYDLSPGMYYCTMTDNCGKTGLLEFEIEDAVAPPPITLANLANEVTHPRHCGAGARGGQVSVVVEQGRGPFAFAWSHGDSTSFVRDLASGEYQVTVSDVCGMEQTTKTYHIGMNAGKDILMEAECAPVQIGLDHATSGGDILQFTHSSDQSLALGVACRGGEFVSSSATWRSFDLANDFDLTEEVTVVGVEVFVQSLPNFENDIGVPVTFTLYEASTAALDDPNLQLTTLQSIETKVPEIKEYTSYVIPFEATTTNTDAILAVKVETRALSGDRHIFDFGANTTPTASPTYFTSKDCQIDDPVTMTSLGFEKQIVMNLLIAKKSGLHYAWSGPVDDPTAAAPMAMGLTSTTYTVTITDQACDLTLVEEIDVSCKTVGTEAPLAHTFRVAPNPSSGYFELLGDAWTGEVELALFDSQGKLLLQEIRHLTDNSLPLDLTGQASGTYFLRLTQEQQSSFLRLVVSAH